MGLFASFIFGNFATKKNIFVWYTDKKYVPKNKKRFLSFVLMLNSCQLYFGVIVFL